MLPKIFVKVSGGLFTSAEFLRMMSRLQYHRLVICVGGGSQINAALEKIGIERKSHGPLGRELATPQLRQVAEGELLKNQALLEDKLARLGITAKVIVPVLDLGGVRTHVNGDQMVKTAYLGFDRLVVMTTPDRLQAKRSIFAELPKVEIVAI
ncbi:MAG: hypothetical protein WC250_01720 [Candidatus Paceibacterota bacterium]|jgi:acetylglutamate kinase